MNFKITKAWSKRVQAVLFLTLLAFVSPWIGLFIVLALPSVGFYFLMSWLTWSNSEDSFPYSEYLFNLSLWSEYSKYILFFFALIDVAASLFTFNMYFQKELDYIPYEVWYVINIGGPVWEFMLNLLPF